MEKIQNYKDALRSVTNKELEQRKTIKRLLQEKESLKKQLTLYGFVKRTLDRKEVAYASVNKWFEDEYDSGTEDDELVVMEKEATELNAQIKVLRFVMAEVDKH